MSLSCALAFLYWPSFRPWFPREGLLPGLPAFGGGPGAYGPAGPRLFEPLTFYVGWMETVQKAGWSFADPNPGGLFGGKHNFDVSGLWLGLEQKINLTETCGLDLDGWVLIPSNRRGSELEGGVSHHSCRRWPHNDYDSGAGRQDLEHSW